VPTYIVTFDGQGATVQPNPASMTVIPPATTVGTLPTAPVKTGYIFGGWYTAINGGGTEFTASTVVTVNITVYAKWSTAPIYTVTFDGQGATVQPNPANMTVTSPATTVGTLPTAPGKTGYFFSGWYTAINGGGTEFTASTVVTTNITVYAKWTTVPTYIVTFDGQGATVQADPANITVTSPATTVGTLPIAPAKTGYIFGGWYTAINGGGTAFTASTVVTTNITVYAKWNNYTYTVTFDDQSATVPPNPTSKTVASPATTVATLPTAPTKTGYIFGGWYTETSGGGTVFTAITVVTASITVYAKWTINKYTLTLSQSVGCSTTTGGGLVSHGVATAISATSKVGYEFVNWNVTSGTGVTIGDVNSATTNVSLTSGDANVRAIFQAKTYTLTITVNPGAGGSVTGGGTVTHGVAQAISATANAGYDFVNWTPSSPGVTFANANGAATTVTLTSGAATIQAVFQLKTYTLTVTVNPGASGSATGGGTVTHGVAQVISATANAGYDFVNWTSSNAGVAFTNASSESTNVILTSGNAVVQANFQLKTYTLAVNAGPNGTAIGSGTLTHGVPWSITATANDGYDFLNLYDFCEDPEDGKIVDGAKYSINAGSGDPLITGRMTLSCALRIEFPEDPTFRGTQQLTIYVTDSKGLRSDPHVITVNITGHQHKK
jgi:uncharacterized repeat protein (TIGR02543 family)